MDANPKTLSAMGALLLAEFATLLTYAEANEITRLDITIDRNLPAYHSDALQMRWELPPAQARLVMVETP